MMVLDKLQTFYVYTTHFKYFFKYRNPYCHDKESNLLTPHLTSRFG